MMNTPHAEDPTWRLIRRLGYAGLIPFVFLALCLWLVGPDLHPYVALSMQGYGAVIVSFLGGIHWGVGFRNALITPTHRASTSPGAWRPRSVAWVGVMMPAFAGLPLLGFVLIGCYLMDRRTWPAAGLGPVAAHALATDPRGQPELLFGGGCNLSQATRMTAIHYTVEAADLHAHLFRVTLTIANRSLANRVAAGVDSGQLSGARVFQKPAKPERQTRPAQGRHHSKDKCTGRSLARPGQPLVLSYEVYAFDNSVRTAWLDSQRGFFNGTSLCLRVHGQEHLPHQLQLQAGEGPSRLASRHGPGTAQDSTKKALACTSRQELRRTGGLPGGVGRVLERHFVACGIPHRFVVAGALPSFDGERLLADTQKICEAEIRFLAWIGQTSGQKSTAQKLPVHAQRRARGLWWPGAPQQHGIDLQPR
jgi:hypothetical protein